MDGAGAWVNGVDDVSVFKMRLYWIILIFLLLLHCSPISYPMIPLGYSQNENSHPTLFSFGAPNY